MSFVQVNRRDSARSIAKATIKRAMAQRGVVLKAFDAPSCKKLEQVADLLAVDERVEITLQGEPLVEKRYLVVYPAGESRKPILGWGGDDYAMEARPRRRPLGEWERRAIIDQFGDPNG